MNNNNDPNVGATYINMRSIKGIIPIPIPMAIKTTPTTPFFFAMRQSLSFMMMTRSRRVYKRSAGSRRAKFFVSITV